MFNNILTKKKGEYLEQNGFKLTFSKEKPGFGLPKIHILTFYEAKVIVFDLGGVLIHWNPRYLYRELMEDEDGVDFFLNNICPVSGMNSRMPGDPLRKLQLY